MAKILGEEWRGLIAGREGYLIESGEAGTVRWGEMVRFGLEGETLHTGAMEIRNRGISEKENRADWSLREAYRMLWSVVQTCLPVSPIVSC